MGLQQRLDQMRSNFVAGADPKILEIMQTAKDRLNASGILEKTLKTGSAAPDFRLEDAHGTIYDSRDLRQNGPLVLTFYRGVW